MPHTDRYDLPLTTEVPGAAAHYVEGLDRLLAYNLGVDEAFQAAIAADPSFALPHAGLANFAFVRGDLAAARASIATAAELVRDASPREQGHVAVVEQVVGGRANEAAGLIDAQLRDYPRDALVLLLRSGAIFYNGGVRKRELMFELFDSFAGDYGDDWWFLTWRAFSHQELDRLEEARDLARRALELRRHNGNGAHAMAHVHFESGEAAEGAGFLSDWFSDFPERGSFYTHLNWHQALFALAQGHPSRALEIYDDAVAPGSGPTGAALGALADQASFLWRCQIYGASADPLPWAAVAQGGLEAFPKPGSAWADVHKGMALAATGNDAEIDRLIDGLRAAAQRGHPTAGSLVAPVVLAMQAFAQADYAGAADGLEGVHAQLVALGGSNAQRDVFEETLAEAYLRSGRFERAEAFLRERLSRRSSARDLFRLGRLQQARDERAPALDEARALWSDADPDSPEIAALAAAG